MYKVEEYSGTVNEQNMHIYGIALLCIALICCALLTWLVVQVFRCIQRPLSIHLRYVDSFRSDRVRSDSQQRARVYSDSHTPQRDRARSDFNKVSSVVFRRDRSLT